MKSVICVIIPAVCLISIGNSTPMDKGRDIKEDPAFDECKHYQFLNDRERAAGFHRGNILKRDQRDLVTPKWYRFTGAAGSEMPTACVPKYYCGTLAPGWLSTSHPTRVGQVVNGKVCFHWGSSCCKWNTTIQIKKCNGFYVYKLPKTPVCWLRYCGNSGFDPCKAGKPCQNGASCVNQNGSYTCLCRPGYQGKNCEQDVNECIAKPCCNGGTSENIPGSYRCKCKPGFLGKHCEIGLFFDECKHHEVLNDKERAAGFRRGNVLKCDQRDLATPKWYRFTQAAGSEMPTACVPKYYCGTLAPGWLSTSHPTRVGQVVNGKVCFHWGSSCCKWNTTIQIKKCNGFYVYKLTRTPVCWLRYCGNSGLDPCKAGKPCQNGASCVNQNGSYTCLCRPGYQGKNCEQVFDECKHYEVLSDSQRATTSHGGNFLMCDQKHLVTPKWYRFRGAAGSQMPTACVPKHRCGTQAPGWLSTSHPTRVGQIVNGKVCFHWGSSCCRWNTAIQIKKCNGFYVYKLTRTPECYLRYCGDAGFDGESKAEEKLPLEDAEESLYREEEPWTSDDEVESFNAPTKDDEDEAEYYEEEPNDAEVEESEQVEDEALTNEDEPEEVPDDEAFETAEEGVEAAQDDGADSVPVGEDTKQQEDEAKEAPVEDETEITEEEDDVKEEDEPEEEDADETPEEEDEVEDSVEAEVPESQDESENPAEDEDDDTFEDDEIEEVPEEEDEAKEEEDEAKEEGEAEETLQTDAVAEQ